ncbi:MAG: signal peptide peptidase SppA [Acidimicrobiia bacterium]
MKQLNRIRKIAYGLAGLTVVTLLVIVVRFLIRPLALLILVIASLLALLVLRVARRDIPRRTVLEIDLDKGIVEKVPTEPIGRALASGAVTLRDVVEALDRGAGDARVVGAVARVGGGDIGLAQAQELRDAVRRFSDAGKRTIVYAETFGEGGLATIPYYLATAFDEIHLQPNGELNIGGLISRNPFFKQFLEKFGIGADLDHRREYKAAMYLLTEDHYTEPHAEATLAVMDSQLEDIVTGIAEARDLRPERVRALIDQAPLLPDQALEAGLVDQLSYRDEAYEAAKGEEGGRLIYFDKYLKRAGRPHRRGASVALIYGVGSIQRGSPRFDPLTRGSSMGSDAVADAFRKAIDSNAVKAIVFRVDSPGGSAVASEVVRRETIRAKEAGKPVVVSMGDVAGSGGYWVSAAADRIVSQPGTITGSIGVVYGKLVTRSAWGRLGVSWDEVHLGENATFSSPDRRYTAAERERFDAYLDAVYDDFKARVSEGRILDLEVVEEVAKGRIWSGRDAHRLGLVDELGGLERAVALAKELVEIPVDQTVKLTVFPRPKTLPLPERRESSEAAELVRALVDLARSSQMARVVHVPTEVGK